MINFAVHWSTSVTHARDVRLRLLHWLQTSGIVHSKLRQEVKPSTYERTNRPHRPTLLRLSVSVLGTLLPSLGAMYQYLQRLNTFCIILFAIVHVCALRRPFHQYVYRDDSAVSCWDIAVWVKRPTLSFLEAEESVNKRLSQLSICLNLNSCTLIAGHGSF